MAGLLALVGGDEFKPGNEAQDRLLAAAAGKGAAYVIPTAAARTRPDLAVSHARRWFAALGLEVAELPVLSRRDARSPELAARASAGRMFYLVGGDPGLVVRVLAGTPVWSAMEQAWRAGAALAGSSAGAMALCAWTLIRAAWPVSQGRRYLDALGVVPATAVVPHFETFGHRWLPSATGALPDPEARLLGLDERTAALWDGRWRVAGAGRVTVVRGGRSAGFGAGEEVAGLPDPRAEGPAQGSP